MENVILIVLLTAAVAVGIWYTIRHFKGEGGCCGGGSYRPRKKKLSHVTGEKTFRVEGMHCEHCKVRVEEAVNDIHGAAGRADWKKGPSDSPLLPAGGRRADQTAGGKGRLPDHRGSVTSEGQLPPSPPPSTKGS